MINLLLLFYNNNNNQNMTFSDITPKHFPLISNNSNSSNFKFELIKSICFVFGSIFISSTLIKRKRKYLIKEKKSNRRILEKEKNDKYIKICVLGAAGNIGESISFLLKLTPTV
jgi:hypothetical protein